MSKCNGVRSVPTAPDCGFALRCAKLPFTSPGGPLISTTPLFAHQYGWDEALLFVIPITIAVIVVRRLDKRSKPDDEPPSEPTEAPGD
jgi:hypothetical protein